MAKYLILSFYIVVPRPKTTFMLNEVESRDVLVMKKLYILRESMAMINIDLH